MMKIKCLFGSIWHETFPVKYSRSISSIPATSDNLSNIASSSSSVSEKKAHWKRTQKNPTHADSLQLRIKGGQGGDGCVAFAREKFNPYGPPSGFNGGNGGSIYIQADPSIQSLARISRYIAAGRGDHGSGDWQAGKQGQDKLIHVPIGTVVRIECIQSQEEADINRIEYERMLKKKFRNAFMRKRRIRLPPSPLEGSYQELLDNFTPEQLRDQRDSMWRHYAGAVGHHIPENETKKIPAKEADEQDEEGEEEEDEEGYGDEDAYPEADDVVDAESDIRGLGRSFREAERRLAFRLLDEEANSREDPDRQETVFDITKILDSPKLIVRGGKGGLGNSFFASTSKNRSPTLATRGESGEEVILHLEWKFKGDVGLIGLPNAGKSTFLKSVCATGDHVRIANYPFTTLTPNVGVVRLAEGGELLGTSIGTIEESNVVSEEREDHDHDSRTPSRFGNDESSRFILQDLPGLVHGASQNRGLGHDFLKHIERCLALYYVVDVSNPSCEPWKDVQLVYEELEKYREGLSTKVEGVIANKCDTLLPEQKTKEMLQTLRQQVQFIHGREVPVWNISAKHRMGVERVAHAMDKVVKIQRAKMGKD